VKGERLDKWIAHHTGRTRKEASKLLRSGRVTVDGAPITDGARKIDPASATVAVDGSPIEGAVRYVVMLHKPRGVLTATRDARDRTVLDLIPADLCPRPLVPVGRLDKDTTGLLLLTDDGALVHALTHPRRHVAKLYRVAFEGPLAPDAPARFEAGVVLEDGTRCRPAHLELTAPGQALVTLREGRHRQVRRMIAALGAEVVGLHRLTMGPIPLDPELPEGAARRLRDDELAALDALHSSRDPG